MIHHVGWEGGQHGWRSPIRGICGSAWFERFRRSALIGFEDKVRGLVAEQPEVTVTELWRKLTALGITVGFEDYVLEPGDSISFESTIPHRLHNEGDEVVTAIWVVVGRHHQQDHAETGVQWASTARQLAPMEAHR